MIIKFITLNLWQGGLLFDDIIAFIKKESPDIIALQEVYNEKNPQLKKHQQTLSVLQKELDYKYFFYSPAFLDERKKDTILNGNAIFSRYPIIANKTVFYDVMFGSVSKSNLNDFAFTPRNLQQATIQTNDTILHIYNTQGIWGFDGKDNQRRLKMSQTIVNEIKNKNNIILAGDFNVSPKTKTIQNIKKYLSNVFNNKLTTTFNLKRKGKGNYATAVVDMIFVSKNIKVLDKYCPPVDISDHLPLVCLLEVDN